MASYRFCRSDDIPLLVRAYNACYRPHFAGLAALTVDDFKRDIRQLDVWTSSCMVAHAGDEPIGVLLAAKRETESLIYRIGVRPDHLRQEHGKHLVDSLGRKLAILGPPRLVAELPEDWTAARAFFESCGYAQERVCTDFVLEQPGNLSEAAALIIPITVDELVANDCFEVGARSCWERASRSLLARKEQLDGLAIASDERIEAWIVFNDGAGTQPLDLLAFYCAEDSRRELLLGLLIRHARTLTDNAVRLPKLDPDELSFDLVQSWGFEPRSRTILYTRP